jgi:hypothetical protein
VLSGEKSRNITINSTPNTYIYYCLPNSLGTPIFAVGGFMGGFSKVASLNFTNFSGYTSTYDIWKSDQSSLGVTTVTIS